MKLGELKVGDLFRWNGRTCIHWDISPGKTILITTDPNREDRVYVLADTEVQLLELAPAGTMAVLKTLADDLTEQLGGGSTVSCLRADAILKQAEALK